MAGFYGVKRRFYFESEAIGRDMGQAPPWEDPLELGNWFDSARAQGLRKKAPPSSLLERVTSARMGEKMVMPEPASKPAKVVKAVPKKKTAPVVVKKAAAPPSRRRVAAPAEGIPTTTRQAPPEELPFDDDDEGGESDAAANLAYMRAEAFRLQREIARHRKRREEPSARVKSDQLKDVLSDLRQWEVSAAKIRQGDDDAYRAMTGKMAMFAGELWELLKRAFLRDCPPEEEKGRRAALNKAAESLPGLMESHFAGVAVDQAKESA